MRSDISARPLKGILTQRETELLPLLAEGLSDKEIATKLHIAIQTVKTHLQSIYKKLNAKGRIAAVIKARVLGLISYD
jgi:LuxR family maltose regulon positive regulatory protein